MAITSLTFPQPIRRRRPAAPRDYARRDHAIELYDEGRFLEAAREALAHLLPGLVIRDLERDPLYLSQGTARVRVHIEGGYLVLSTVLAQLGPKSNVVAALRYYLTRVSSTGQLYQPRLRGDTITLEFRDQLSLLHPLKLIEVMQRLPGEADNNDAWMIDQFGVSTPDRAPVEALSEDEFERAHAIWVAHWAAVDELMLESRRRRSVRFLNALGSYALDHLRYTLPLFGSIRSELVEAADTFNDSDVNPGERDAELAKCIREMKKIDAEGLRACLGHCDYAIEPLQAGTPALLTKMLGGGNRMQVVGELRGSGRSLEAALELLTDYIYLLAYNAWPTEVEASLRGALDQASGKPWREIADVLWSHASSAAQAFGSHGENDREDASEEDAVNHYQA